MRNTFTIRRDNAPVSGNGNKVAAQPVQPQTPAEEYFSDFPYEDVPAATFTSRK